MTGRPSVTRRVSAMSADVWLGRACAPDGCPLTSAGVADGGVVVAGAGGVDDVEELAVGLDGQAHRCERAEEQLSQVGQGYRGGGEDGYLLAGGCDAAR